MHTRNSPPQAKDNLPLPPSLEPTAKANWSLNDETSFINYIADHKAEAGDGMKFKTSFWNGAADLMKAHTEAGGPKTAAACSSKWDRVHITLIAPKNLTFFSSSKSLTTSSLHSKSYQGSAGMMIRA